MAALTCEICGGKLIGKPGGVFECDSCGMEYSTEWARNKIQEIKGTVKIEGTVEVTGKVQLDGGTVNVEGAATKESLLKRAKMCVNDGDWTRAKELLEQVLNADPECGEAYLYRAMAQNSCKTIEMLKGKYISGSWQSENDFDKAIQFGAISAEQAQEWKKAREEKRLALAKAREEKLHRLARARERIKGAQGLINRDLGVKTDGTVYCRYRSACDDWEDIVAVSDNDTIGIKADGTVVGVRVSLFKSEPDKPYIIEDWRDIVAVSYDYPRKLGLRRDGTIATINGHPELKASDWHDIIAIHAKCPITIGVRADGSVVIDGDDYHPRQSDVSGWHDIVAVSGSNQYLLGLKADGTIVTVGDIPNKLRPVLEWSNIIAISASQQLAVGLKEDGSVVCCANDDAQSPWVTEIKKDGSVVRRANDYKIPSELDWRDVVAIIVHVDEAYGLKSDGTVVSSKADSPMNSWKLFDNLDNLEDERRVARAKRAEEKRLAEELAREEKRLAEEKALQEKKERIQALHQEMDSLQAELAALRGLFNGRKRKELEARMEDMKWELRKLDASVR